MKQISLSTKFFSFQFSNQRSIFNAKIYSRISTQCWKYIPKKFGVWEWGCWIYSTRFVWNGKFFFHILDFFLKFYILKNWFLSKYAKLKSHYSTKCSNIYVNDLQKKSSNAIGLFQKKSVPPCWGQRNSRGIWWNSSGGSKKFQGAAKVLMEFQGVTVGYPTDGVRSISGKAH